MVDFTISQSNLAKVSQLMTKARTKASQELVELSSYSGNVKFVVTGRESTVPAAVETPGQAWLPLSILPKLRKIAATFGESAVRIRIENGRIRVNSMSISMPEIAIGKITDRPVDIPDNAPLRDILALKYLFSPEEMAASDLASRYMAANSARIKAIDSAASTLAAFEITPTEIESRSIPP